MVYGSTRNNPANLSAYRTYCPHCRGRFLTTKQVRQHQEADRCSKEHPHPPTHSAYLSLKEKQNTE